MARTLTYSGKHRVVKKYQDCKGSCLEDRPIGAQSEGEDEAPALSGDGISPLSQPTSARNTKQHTIISVRSFVIMKEIDGWDKLLKIFGRGSEPDGEGVRVVGNHATRRVRLISLSVYYYSSLVPVRVS